MSAGLSFVARLFVQYTLIIMIIIRAYKTTGPAVHFISKVGPKLISVQITRIEMFESASKCKLRMCCISQFKPSLKTTIIKLKLFN